MEISLTYSQGWLIVVSVLLCILILWTLVGNGLVLISLIKFRFLRSISNYLIGNLAISDFLLSLTLLPLSAVNDILGYWIFGMMLCNIWLSIDVLYCTASIWGLVAIAFDRFTATTFPVWYRKKKSSNRVWIYVSLVWILSLTICVPPLIGWNGTEFEEPEEKFHSNYIYDNVTMRHQCVLFSEKNYVIYSAMGSFIIPLFIMSIMYFRIFVMLQQRAKRMRVKYKNSKARKYNSINLENRTATEVQPSSIANSVIGARNKCDSPIFKMSSHLNDPVIEHDATVESNAYAQFCGQPLLGNGIDECRHNESSSSERVDLMSQEDGHHDDGGHVKDLDHFKQRFATKLKRTATKTSGLRSARRSSTMRCDRREQRATKRMALIIALFVLCWIPFTLMYLTRSLCGDTDCPDILHLRMFVIWLGYANSGLNPILYTIFNDDFRRAFYKILC